MPYIITTTAPEAASTVEPGQPWPRSTTRRAVTTLDEAQDGAMRTVIAASVGHGDANWDGYAHDARTLLEAGGTIGPLPDGTVIEVEPIGFGTLTARAGFAQFSDERSPAQVIDAFNAAQVS